MLGHAMVVVQQVHAARAARVVLPKPLAGDPPKVPAGPPRVSQQGVPAVWHTPPHVPNQQPPMPCWLPAESAPAVLTWHTAAAAQHRVAAARHTAPPVSSAAAVAQHAAEVAQHAAVVAQHSAACGRQQGGVAQLCAAQTPKPGGQTFQAAAKPP